LDFEFGKLEDVFKGGHVRNIVFSDSIENNSFTLHQWVKSIIGLNLFDCSLYGNTLFLDPIKDYIVAVRDDLFSLTITQKNSQEILENLVASSSHKFSEALR
jgi:hypothetical protein